MKFHYDVSAAEPIIRDTRVYDAANALDKGTAMAHGAVGTAENCGCAIIADPIVCSNIIGVLNEDLSAANMLSVVAAGTDKYGKIIINPLAVWLAEVSQAAADDTVTSTTTRDTLTGTCVTDHERGWAYVTDVGDSTAGFGNLFQIGASTDTSAIVMATSTAATDLVSTSSSDTFIVLPAPYSADVAGGGLDLATNCEDLSGYAGTGAGAIVPLENYILSNTRPLEPLVASKHSGFNFKSEDPKFYTDIMFPEHLLLGGKVNDRVIT